ncbi:ty3-gypsy retrotransposon protein [Cucumis melo var. makuwa]|uniref:Ty3-gypsy retrotransposon protein n=1 Tax=Cucumis melo var. makuwa TaxID=1194695 RepID=A0A5D3BGT7_CUCMM|nr:ty3-gypsy retrotransposon protein [Cucumis melo var. makuwa]
MHEEDKDFPRPQRLVTLVDFFPTRFLCDHQDENPRVVACHAINAMEEESIPLRSLEEEEVSKDLLRFNVDDLLSLPQETKSILINTLLNSVASSSSTPTVTYESTLYCMSIDFLDEDLLLGFKLHNRPLFQPGQPKSNRRVKKVKANSNLFSQTESHSADAKFYLKNDNSPEVVPVEIPLVNREDNLQLKSLASKEPHKSIGTFHSRKGEASTSTTKSMILMDEKTSNPLILCYVPLSRRQKGESPFVKFPQGLKVGDMKS